MKELSRLKRTTDICKASAFQTSSIEENIVGNQENSVNNMSVSSVSTILFLISRPITVFQTLKNLFQFGTINDNLPLAQDNEESLSIIDGMYQDDCCQLSEEKNESNILKYIIANSENQVQNHISHKPKGNKSKNDSTIAMLGYDKETFDATLQVNIELFVLAISKLSA